MRVMTSPKSWNRVIAGLEPGMLRCSRRPFIALIRARPAVVVCAGTSTTRTLRAPGERTIVPDADPGDPVGTAFSDQIAAAARAEFAARARRRNGGDPLRCARGDARVARPQCRRARRVAYERSSTVARIAENVRKMSIDACASVSPSTLNDVSEQSPVAWNSRASTSVAASVSSM